MKWRYPYNEKERSPGPAAYNQKWNTIENVVNSQYPVNIERVPMSYINPLPKNTTPGPGQYHTQYKYDNRGYKFSYGGRTGDKPKDGPGPGHYYIP